MRTNTTGNYNVSVGSVALYYNTTGSNNVALGTQALNNNTTASNNTAVGYQAMLSNTTGTVNAAFGRETLASNTTGQSNTAFGTNALYANTTASNNTAVGYQSGYSNTTGSENTAIGYNSLYTNTTGSNNSAIGRFALRRNTTGSDNASLGLNSMEHNTTGSYNTGLGRGALINNTTASQNTAVGYQAGSSSATSNNNTFIGYTAGQSVTGNNNTMLGSQAGQLITSGTKNTIIGLYNGNQGGLDIRTSSNNIVLSDGDGNPRASYSPAGSGFWRFGHTATGNLNDGSASGVSIGQSGYIVISHSGGSVLNLNSMGTTGQFIALRNGNNDIGSISTNQSTVSYNTSSDYRLKENVVELTGATNRLKQLEPKRFNFIVDADTTVDGFLAHEVQSIVPEAITGEKDAVNDDGTIKAQGIDQSKLVPLLVKTIQELEARITALEGA
jgi:hypothetical protein